MFKLNLANSINKLLTSKVFLLKSKSSLISVFRYPIDFQTNLRILYLAQFSFFYFHCLLKWFHIETRLLHRDILLTFSFDQDLPMCRALYFPLLYFFFFFQKEERTTAVQSIPSGSLRVHRGIRFRGLDDWSTFLQRWRLVRRDSALRKSGR